MSPTNLIPDSNEPAEVPSPSRRISASDFQTAWAREVPKIVAQHREEVLAVRQALGLAEGAA